MKEEGILSSFHLNTATVEIECKVYHAMFLVSSAYSATEDKVWPGNQMGIDVPLRQVLPLLLIGSNASHHTLLVHCWSWMWSLRAQLLLHSVYS